MVEDIVLKDEIIGEEDGLVLMVSEPPSRDIAEQLADLQTLKGSGFISMLREITQHRAFCLLEGESNIYITGGKKEDDYDNLLNAARKAVEHGYRVYILPNPKGIRTADFIFERKGVYKMFDLKTISGKSSARNRLMESIGQTNHVILNMTTNYDPRLLAKDIQLYFETNKEAREVLIIKGNKFLSVSRRFVEGRYYIKMFMKRYLR